MPTVRDFGAKCARSRGWLSLFCVPDRRNKYPPDPRSWHSAPDSGTEVPQETGRWIQGREVLASPWRRLRAVRLARTVPVPKSLRKQIFKFLYYMLNRYHHTCVAVKVRFWVLSHASREPLHGVPAWRYSIYLN